MDTKIPSTSEVMEIIDYLRFAPTGDNSQFWNYRWNGEVLEILYDEKRADHVLNNKTMIFVAFGLVVEILEMSSYSLGWKPFVKLSFFGEIAQGRFAEVSFEKISPVRDSLIDQIKERHTNRKKFGIKPLNPEWITEINKQFNAKGVIVHSIENFSQDFRHYLMICEQYIWHNRNVFFDTEKWIRYSKKQELKFKDGMNLANVNLDFIAGIFLRIFVIFPFIIRPMWTLGLKLKVMLDIRSQFKNLSNIVAVSIGEQNQEHYITAGRAMYKTWLKLANEGYGVQPLTIASSTAYNFRLTGKLKGGNSFYKNIFKNSKELMDREFNLEGRQIIWMFRTGPANPLKITQRTMRRDLSWYIR